MRRTYRSKKDASGALDPKDVLLTMDEKSSAFDAFYIQNIKQTKREMSSVNFLAAPPSKVRKRKYVKRIVKDPEPLKESALDSVYLTPNKSLHVNKPMDPFDQLLNSPSTKRNDSIQVNKGGLFGFKNEAKTYFKRKARKLKKYNYSSSETSESDKENSDNCKTPDKSNILKHELFIEKKNSLSPITLDKSIKDLVQNFSLLRKSSPKTPGKISEPFKFINHRLTTNIKSPTSQDSPLCSTPFKEKYRGASIYKFSPISTKILSESLHNNTSQSNSNNSIIFIEKNKQHISNVEENNLSEDICKSPVFKTPDNYKLPSVSVEECKLDLVTDKSHSLCRVTQQTSVEKPDTISIIADKIGTDKLEEPALACNEYEQSDNKAISSIELSSLQTTETEPFLGFSGIRNVPKTSQKELDNSLQTHETGVAYGPEDDTDNNKDLQTSIKTLDSKNNSDASQYNHSLQNSIMLFSNDSPIENEFNEDCGSVNQQDNSAGICQPLKEDEDRQNEENIVSETSCTSSIDSKNSSQNSFETDGFNNDVSESSENKSSSSQNSDNQSLYDTCDSGDLSQDKSIICFSKLPVVQVERLNDSMFHKYYSKMANIHLENSDSCQDSDDYESVDDISDLSNNSHANTSNSEKEDCNLDTSKDISYDNDTDSNSYTDEDRCISFVTTRRRNEVTNDSMFLAFNDSHESVSSSECDKTVLSNRISGRKSDLVDNEATLVNDPPQSPVVSISADIKKDKAGSIVTTRKSAKESLLKEGEHRILEFKPSIVLQPGKKWERSLSIYRRMTMMNDNFDHSVLEEEPLDTKGRKYRQSVIITMEMQDKGLLHNESINSRRSTFVSKPCRSTIRIVKEQNNSSINLCATAVFDDLKGFLNEDCDDTIVELSKLSIADSEHEVTVLETFHDTAGRVATARDYVLRRCNQTEVLLFDECYPDTVLKNCHKIGEGVYGEVFLWRARDGRARVMKIVPIAGTIKVNGESQKDFHEIISEIVIAMELSALRAPIAEIDRHFDEGKDIDALDLHSVENATDVFNEVLAVRCVYGSYPSRLLDLWELYDECKGSENDNPAILPVDQQYIVLELANAGQDLESYQFNSAEQAHALFLQLPSMQFLRKVAFALAVGEESFQFEHRDLHWGNVLISPTDQKFATFVLRGRAHRVARCGVAATIIDYSLSRLSLPLSHADCAALYNDLSTDDGLFDALGDYQFEVYRRMRDKLGNDWKNFEPYTNILWLHYTVDKMITALRYKRTNTKIHKHYIAKLKGIKNRILDYGSAAQFVLTDNEF